MKKILLLAVVIVLLAGVLIYQKMLPIDVSVEVVNTVKPTEPREIETIEPETVVIAEEEEMETIVIPEENPEVATGSEDVDVPTTDTEAETEDEEEDLEVDHKDILENIEIKEVVVKDGIRLEGIIPSSIPSDLVSRISITSCTKNYSEDYDTPYVLKTYEYPDFKYVIMAKYENVCIMPYKIKFIAVGGKTLGEIHYTVKKIDILKEE